MYSVLGKADVEVVSYPSHSDKIVEWLKNKQDLVCSDNVVIVQHNSILAASRHYDNNAELAFWQATRYLFWIEFI